MQKSDLVGIVKKYYLDGLIPTVKCTVKDKTLIIGKKSIDGSVLVLLDANLDLEDAEFGILDTGVLLTLLGALDEDLKIQYQYTRNKLTGLNLSDAVVNATCMLGDTSLPDFDSNSLRSDLPEFDVVIPLKKELIDKFVKSKKSLSDSRIVAFLPSESSVDAVINFDPERNSNKITIEFPATVTNQFDVAAFNIDPIVKAMSANSDFREGFISISYAGLMEIRFKSEEFEAKYYLNKLDLS